MRRKKDPKKNDEINSEADQNDIFVERVRLENMELRLSIMCEFFYLNVVVVSTALEHAFMLCN